MPVLVRKSLVLAKGEATEGTDSSPSASTDALLVSAVAPSINAEMIERDILKQSLSSLGAIPGVRSMQVTFTTELRGRGAVPTAGSPLRDNPLFLAAGLSPTYATSSAVYRPTASPVSATIYVYLDGILVKMKGCYGNVELVGEVGQFGRLNWTFQGVFDAIPSGVTAGDIRDEAFATATFDAFTLKPPTVLSASASVHTVTSLVIQALNVNMNNDVQQRPDISSANGIKSFFITGRRPSGTINPEAVTRGVVDFWKKWQDSTEGVVSMQVGSVGAGNAVKIVGNAVQFGVPQWGERNNIRTFEVPTLYNAASSAGDDEIEIQFLT